MKLVLCIIYFVREYEILTFGAAPCRCQRDMTVAANGAILPVRPVTTVYFEASGRVNHCFIITAGSYFHTCG